MNTATVNPNAVALILPVAVVETRQGMYRVERTDDSSLDKNVKTYNTADETDEGKFKYHLIITFVKVNHFHFRRYVANTND